MKFFYLKDERNNPVSCVASELSEEGKIVFAVSTHNPIDQFSRTVARNVAAGRLATRTHCFTTIAGHNVKARITHIVSRCRDYKVTPTRARKAAKLWLKKALAANKKAAA